MGGGEVKSAVHPRVCGEHSPAVALMICDSGSSPRVRGTRLWRCHCSVPVRFIPACAGNTWKPRTTPISLSVHPRVCGEHWLVGLPRAWSGGSSPRVRGTRFTAQGADYKSRFIPACAGNTWRGMVYLPIRSVHPRVCGEHSTRLPSYARSGGSSPRVRGTRPGSVNGIDVCRFIPACAGNTSVVDVSVPSRPVHPRVCGEHDAA